MRRAWSQGASVRPAGDGDEDGDRPEEREPEGQGPGGGVVVVGVAEERVEVDELGQGHGWGAVRDGEGGGAQVGRDAAMMRAAPARRWRGGVRCQRVSVSQRGRATAAWLRWKRPARAKAMAAGAGR